MQTGKGGRNMTQSKTIGICVYGASSDAIDPSFIQAGESLGQGIAQRGWRLVFGAGATGMMGAAVRGVKAAGGKAAGIAPFFFDQPGILYNDLDDMLFVRTMRERKAFMESFSSAFVITPGGVGTLEEFYEILVLKQLAQLDAPIAILNTNNFYTPLLDAMGSMSAQHFIAPDVFHLFEVFQTPEEVLAWLDQTLSRPE